jgi:hypothetical protein
MVSSLEDNLVVTHALLGRSNKPDLASEYQSKNIVVWTEEEFLLNCCIHENVAPVVLKPPKDIIVL